VPYLPIDPQDVGRSYEKIIQINSQSGKGGVAYVMDVGFQRRLPKAMHPEFAAVIQRHSEETGAEVSPQMIATLFSREYLAQDAPFRYVDFRSWSTVGHADVVEALLVVEVNGERRELSGIGNGPIAAAKQALLSGGCPYFEILDYREHARGAGSDAEAIAYIQVELQGGVRRYGAAIDPNTATASLKALLSALNRALQHRHRSDAPARCTPTLPPPSSTPRRAATASPPPSYGTCFRRIICSRLGRIASAAFARHHPPTNRKRRTAG
jgi:2-isopropylmalate synthase